MAKNLELFDEKSDVVSTYTHSFFPYPAKFPPEPIRDFIRGYSSKGETILDPFCGSGTVLVEAILNGRNARGIELNPVAALVSKAKATIYDDSHIQEAKEFLKDISMVEKIRDSWLKDSISDSDIPTYKNIDLWFKPNMLQELTAIRKKFLIHSEYSNETQKLLWMAFLKIIVPVSNQDGETRYTAVKKQGLINGYALGKMRETVRNYVRTLEDFLLEESNHLSANVEKADTNEGLNNIENNSIDLVITSPPYINTFDYYLYHKHRIFWMDENPQEIRKKEVGCHHRIDTMTYERAFKEYSDYMETVLSKVFEKLKKNKHFIMLIGDGIVKNKMVYADQLITALAEKIGFTVKEINTIKLREVSSRFIKGKTIDRKNHHAIVLRK
jgi:DNA modification methylase